MYMTQQEPNQLAYSVEKSAASLGVDEFSLVSRIQAGEINAVRARSGEIKIPESELGTIGPRVAARASAGNHAVAEVARPALGH